MSGSSDEEPAPKRRRGVSHTENYKRNVVREARVKGQEYVSYSGREVAGKSKPNNISCKCPAKCFRMIDQTVIENNWTYFYSIENKNSQDTYIQTLIESREVKRRKKVEQDNAVPDQGEQNFKRNHTFLYNVKINGALQHVCKQVFMAIYGISRKRIQRICQLLMQNNTPKDLRGLNRSGNAVPGHVCVDIHNHISKFEVRVTHYGSREKKYLDSRLSVREMHDMFLRDNPGLKDVVKYSFYNKYFIENFGYSFGRPQVDVCSMCESLTAKLRDRNLNDAAKRVAAAELMVHKRRAKKFYNGMTEISKDKNQDTAALCFDYMQNLPLPNIPVQEIFYMRQLWVNVFCIHDLKSNKAKLYVYHEGEGNKGPDEVCSFLLDYITTELPNSVKKLILYSDGPSGQNKNHTVVRFLMNMCDRGQFDQITHNFPVRGHSFSPCDRDFGPIKRLVKKIDRIYTPEQYIELILKASKTNRFSVHEVVTSVDLLNFKDWWPLSYKKLTNSDETSGRGTPREMKESFKVSQYKQFVYDKNTPGKVVVRAFIDGATQSTFSLLKVNVAPNLPTQLAYPTGKVSNHFNFMKNCIKLNACLVKISHITITQLLC